MCYNTRQIVVHYSHFVRKVMRKMKITTSENSKKPRVTHGFHPISHILTHILCIFKSFFRFSPVGHC